MGGRYTAEEDAIIIENYPKALTPQWVHLLPSRTLAAIQKRAQVLGLHHMDRQQKLQSRAINRFFSHIKKDDVTGCWEWTGVATNSGHGAMGACGGMVLAHRFSWMYHYGDIADGLQVCHKCDNPPCCNPEHLFLGTNEDNQRDCAVKGRKANKITATDVVEIRRLLADGVTQVKIAQRFGISDALVRHIKSGRQWKHVGANV